MEADASVAPNVQAACETAVAECPDLAGRYGVTTPEACEDAYACTRALYTGACAARLDAIYACFMDLDRSDCTACNDVLAHVMDSCPYPEQCLGSPP